ncbi:MAG: hypothetical protein ABSA57_17450 [Candidatus Acidiferrales bacterium]
MKHGAKNRRSGNVWILAGIGESVGGGAEIEDLIQGYRAKEGVAVACDLAFSYTQDGPSPVAHRG